MGTNKEEIEKQEILAESPRRSYEMIRLSRVKYRDNPFNFIDIRLFQRGYKWNDEFDTDEEEFYPTKKGVQFKEDQFQRLIGKWTLVPSMLFHQVIMEQAWPSIVNEDFSTAVFKAFKAVEVSVRNASGLPQELVGTSLMRKAFAPNTGPLADHATPTAEQEALAHLFSGSIGIYKNPHSHRDVETTFREAFEMLLVASHLLNIVDRKLLLENF